MKSVLENIFTHAFEDCAPSAERIKNERKTIKLYDEFFSTLSEEQKKVFLKFFDFDFECKTDDEQRIFTRGFSLGAKLMMEILTEN